MFYQFLSWKSPLRLLSSLGYFSQLIVLQFPPEFPLSPALTESQSYSRMLGMSLCDHNFKLKYSIKTLTSRWVSVVDRIYKMAAFLLVVKKEECSLCMLLLSLKTMYNQTRFCQTRTVCWLPKYKLNGVRITAVVVLNTAVSKKGTGIKALKCTLQPRKVLWVVFRSRWPQDLMKSEKNVTVRTRHCGLEEFIFSFDLLKHWLLDT